MKLNKFTWVLTFLIYFSLNTVWALQISRVKGKKAMIKISSEDQVEKGDLYYIYKKKKRVGILKILKVNGDRAFGKIQGKAYKGARLKKKMKKTKRAKKIKEKPSSNKVYIGGLLGMGSNSMDVTDSGTKRSLSGTGINFSAFLDYPLFSWLDARGYVGMLNLNAEVSETGCTKCNVEISYIQLGGVGRLVFDMGQFKPWVGGGYNILVPMSKDKTTALNTEKIALTSIIGFYGGLDYMLNPTMKIPFEFSYNLLPSSDSASGSVIGLNVGFAYGF